jgi:phosphate-selective porin OprO/OprP
MASGNGRERGALRASRAASVLAVVVALAAAEARSCPAQTPLRAYYDDDFILATGDGAFELRVGGNLHMDTRLYRAEVPGAVQNLDIRRARIDLFGRVHRRFTFRVQPELSGSPYLRNAWVDWEAARALHLRWGQMKVPFSTSWLTQDNNLNFVERGTASPVHPFFDRGFMARGELFGGGVVYDVGVYTGAGADADASRGDIDSGEEWVARLFVRPLRGAGGSAGRGLTLVVEGTLAGMSVPTARYETRGLRSAGYGSTVWRWRTEQVLGTDGRAVDRVGATIEGRRRLGAEVHWLWGPVALSSELLEVRYDDVALFHDLWIGTDRVAHVPLGTRSGAIRSWTSWLSWYPTGQSKELHAGGWRTAGPATGAEAGKGAWEVLARFSRTTSDPDLFEPLAVAGFTRAASPVPGEYTGPLPGAGHQLTAAVLDGAHEVNEVTLGLNWTVNPMVRLQLNTVVLWAPPSDRTGDGVNDNRLVSGALPARSEPTGGVRRTKWESAAIVRLAFKF